MIVNEPIGVTRLAIIVGVKRHVFNHSTRTAYIEQIDMKEVILIEFFTMHVHEFRMLAASVVPLPAQC